jgi:hypothetical protein
LEEVIQHINLKKHEPKYMKKERNNLRPNIIKSNQEKEETTQIFFILLAILIKN